MWVIKRTDETALWIENLEMMQKKRRLFRILFAFDPKREIILLVGGDKRGNKQFYKKMIPIAERLYEKHLKRR